MDKLVRATFGLYAFHSIGAARLPAPSVHGYSHGMKTAVSIPDGVFKDAERFAREHGRSRSELYSDALGQYLVRHSSDCVTEAMNKVCEVVEAQDDGFVRAASRRALRRQTW